MGLTEHADKIQAAIFKTLAEGKVCEEWIPNLMVNTNWRINFLDHHRRPRRQGQDSRVRGCRHQEPVDTTLKHFIGRGLNPLFERNCFSLDVQRDLVWEK
jgi:hypothetical protein